MWAARAKKLLRIAVQITAAVSVLFSAERTPINNPIVTGAVFQQSGDRLNFYAVRNNPAVFADIPNGICQVNCFGRSNSICRAIRTRTNTIRANDSVNVGCAGEIRANDCNFFCRAHRLVAKRALQFERLARRFKFHRAKC
jgi:hypothetical protein